jgi:hypothetical protein
MQTGEWMRVLEGVVSLLSAMSYGIQAEVYSIPQNDARNMTIVARLVTRYG